MPTSPPWSRRGLAAGLLISLLALHPLAAQAQAAIVPQAQAARPPTDAEINEVKALLADLDRDPDAIVAEIDGRAVTRADVAVVIRAMPAALDARPSREVFQAGARIAMDQKVLAVRAAALGLDKLPSVAHRMANAAEDVLADAYLRGALNANITEEVLRRAYDQSVAGRPGRGEVDARVIVTDRAEAGETVLSRVVAGASFDSVARTDSKDPTAARGGALGYLAADMLAPEIAAVLFSMDVGQTTAHPVQSGDHWFVMQVMGRRAGPAPSFEAARPALAHDLAMVEVDRIKKWAVADAKVVFEGGLPEGPAAPSSPLTAPQAIENALAQFDQSPETVVADVNGRHVTFADVAEAIRALPRVNEQATFQSIFRQAAELVVDRKVLAEKAVAAGLASDPAVRRRMEAAQDRALGRELLQRSLKPNLLEPTVRSIYEARPDSRAKVQEVQLRVIAAGTRTQAEDLIRRIKDGAAFADVARESGRDSSAANGGLLDYRRQDALAPELAAVGFALPVDGMTAYPVQSGGVWWVVRCEGRRERPPLTFAEARPTVERSIVRTGSADLQAQAIMQTNITYYGLIGKPAPAAVAR